jgi:tellurite methyltransferase
MNESHLLIVTGERGAGKTTFCTRLVELARSSGWQVAGVLSPAVIVNGVKVAIDVERVRSGQRRRLADFDPESHNPCGMRWDFDADALAWGNAALAESTPCKVLIVDELGVLEFELGQGWQAGLAALDSGDYRLGVVVIRSELLAKAQQRWPAAQIVEIAQADRAKAEAERLIQKFLPAPLDRRQNMSTQDANRWNQRYQTDGRKSDPSPRSFLVENAAALPREGLALDVAMGLGGNAAFLLARGLRVVGMDVSEVAVRRAKSRLPDLLAVTANLTQFCLRSVAFDAIVNFYFLERSLWPIYRRALKPDGVLIVETLTEDMLTIRPDIDPAYLLRPGELYAAFQDWNVLTYREGWIDQDSWYRAAASLVARRS